MSLKIIKKIENDKKIIFSVLVIIFLIILFFNIRFLHIVVFGILFSIFYFLIIFIWLGRILGKILNLEKEFQFLFGLFLLLYLIAFGLAVPIVFFRITPIYFYIFLLILTLVISLLNHRLQKKSQSTNQDTNLQTGNKNEGIKIYKIFYFLFFIFYILAWFFIFKARRGEYILSPWDAISKYYQLLWFILSFLLIVFIFSKAKVKTILFLLILASLLFHAYLPIVSENSFGVDRWRHLGAERRLIEGNIEPPALIGEINYLKLGPISLPQVFLMPNKFSYSNQWGMSIALSWLTGLDILKIDQYLIYFLWSLFFTIFVYKLAQIIFDKEKLSLLITFISLFCFFSLQVAGAITVPHAIGLLPFLFFLIILFSYLKNKDKNLWPLIIFSFVLLIFNYILYLILAFEIFVFGLILRNRGKWKKFVLPILVVIFILSLPLLDRISGTTFFAYKPFAALKILPQKIGEFVVKVFPSYLYYRGGGNLALSNLIKNLPWVLIFTPLVFLFAILGLIKNWKNNLVVKILVFFLFIFLINQFLSFSFMKNYRLLCQRLNNVLLLFLVIFFATGLYWLIENMSVKYHDRNKQQTEKASVLIILFMAVFLSTLSITTYVSGPAYGNVTKDELAIAKYLDQEIRAIWKVRPSKTCVFDAGWRLLALEAINGMIAGNFPTDPIDFVQKEKDELYRQMLKNPSKEILDKTLEITGAKKCFFVANQEWLKPEVFDKIKNILGEPAIRNNTYIWKYGE